MPSGVRLPRFDDKLQTLVIIRVPQFFAGCKYPQDEVQGHQCSKFCITGKIVFDKGAVRVRPERSVRQSFSRNDLKGYASQIKGGKLKPTCYAPSIVDERLCAKSETKVLWRTRIKMKGNQARVFLTGSSLFLTGSSVKNLHKRKKSASSVVAVKSVSQWVEGI